jgi:cation:H+ antiporter
MLLLLVVFFIVGIALLVQGAGWLIHAAERLGTRARISPFAIGVVILGFGTSLPELFSSVMAQLEGAGEMVIGNVLGSNIANVLLIVALAAVFGRGIQLSRSIASFDQAWLTVASATFLWMAYDLRISPGEVLMLLVLFAIYGMSMYADVREQPAHHQMAHDTGQWRDVLFLCVGFLTLLVGAYLTVSSASNIALMVGISAGVVGLLGVAIGTSLPELTVTVRSIRKNPDLAIGNIYGSNIFNLLIVLGLPGLIGPMPIGVVTYAVGIPFFIVATGLLIHLGHSKYLGKYGGMLALALFFLFVGLAALAA